jgi:Fic-DOC domain mobile mystery protein B
MDLDAPLPGQTPLPDLSGLRQRHVRTTSDLKLAEAENVRRAVIKHLMSSTSPRRARFDVPWMQRLHRDMFGRVWLWAGGLRRHETNIGVAPHRVETELHSLVADLGAWHGSAMPLHEQAARLHHRAVAIHPFANGNGRWSRMLANIWLRRNGARWTEWPEATIGASSVIRGRYLDALRAADAGDLGPLTVMHAEFG